MTTGGRTIGNRGILACLLLPLILISGMASAAVAQQGERVVLANPGYSLNFLIFYVGQEQGFYRQQGLNQVMVYINCALAIKALLVGDVDYTGCVGSASRLIITSGVAVTTVMWSFERPTFYLVARPEVKSVAALRGKNIGITSFGSDTDMATRATLKHYGLDPDRDVRMLQTGVDTLRYAALRAGSIDATPMPPPYNTQAKLEGFTQLAYTGDIIKFPQSGFSVTLKKLKEQREQVKRMIRATYKALLFTNGNRAGTIPVIMKYWQLDEKMAAGVYDSLHPSFSRDGTVSEEALKAMIDSITLRLKVTQEIPFSRFVDYALLKEVQRELR